MLLASAGLLGAVEPGATPPLVASVVFLGVVVRGVTAVTQHTATSRHSTGGGNQMASREPAEPQGRPRGGWAVVPEAPGTRRSTAVHSIVRRPRKELPEPGGLEAGDRTMLWLDTGSSYAYPIF